MNTMKLFGFVMLASLAIYGITMVGADDDVTDVTDCPQDGSGAFTHGNHHGDMDGTGIGDQTQARDGSGVGGMHGSGTGDCTA
ncbi:MAG: hypothetical protein INQ03_08095 [Candidatus Heimdallarchaeota archaeon]|nr:hypothetical protein [Candidatus Heimdallarchaeota archaeon]